MIECSAGGGGGGPLSVLALAIAGVVGSLVSFLLLPLGGELVPGSLVLRQRDAQIIIC